MKENPPRVDPFSPQNLLIFTLGPLADTPFYGSSRYAVFTKSPQTGIYSESYSGGKITFPLSRTGYDAVIIEGRSEDPIFLEIGDEKVNFHSASNLSFNLSDYFKENLKKGRKFYVEGRLSRRDYTDKDGIKRYNTEVITETLIPLEPSSEGASTEEQETSVEPSVSNDNDDLPF